MSYVMFSIYLGFLIALYVLGHYVMNAAESQTNDQNTLPKWVVETTNVQQGGDFYSVLWETAYLWIPLLVTAGLSIALLVIIFLRVERRQIRRIDQARRIIRQYEEEEEGRRIDQARRIIRQYDERKRKQEEEGARIGRDREDIRKYDERKKEEEEEGRRIEEERRIISQYDERTERNEEDNARVEEARKRVDEYEKKMYEQPEDEARVEEARKRVDEYEKKMRRKSVEEEDEDMLVDRARKKIEEYEKKGGKQGQSELQLTVAKEDLKASSDALEEGKDLVKKRGERMKIIRESINIIKERKILDALEENDKQTKEEN